VKKYQAISLTRLSGSSLKTCCLLVWYI